MQAERLKILLEYLEKEPQDPFNRYAVAMELVKTDLNAAIEHLKVLINDHADYLPTYYQFAGLYFELEKYKEAEELYKNGIALAQLQGNTKIEKELRGALQQLIDETSAW